MPQKRLERRLVSVDLEEFRALVMNLVPSTLEQAEWICSEVERLTRDNPELREKFEEWCRMPEREEKELREIIEGIIAEAEGSERERKAWLDEKLRRAGVNRSGGSRRNSKEEGS